MFRLVRDDLMMFDEVFYACDSDFALDKGLFTDDFKSEQYKKTGHPAKKDFEVFAKRIGVMDGRFEKLMHPFLEKQASVETLIRHSFLNEANKRGCLQLYWEKRNYLVG